MTKKIKITFFLTIFSVFFLGAAIYWSFNSKNAQDVSLSLKPIVNNTDNVSTATNASSSNPKIPAGNFKGVEKFAGEKPIDEDAADALEKLKAELPQLTEDQLLVFSNAAKEKSIAICHSRKDEKVCAFSVAFISRIHNFCGDLGHDHAAHDDGEAEEKIEPLECYDKILDKKADVEVYNCYNKKFETNDELVQCLTSVFPSSYEKSEDCQGISQESVRNICEGVARYRKALMTGEVFLCQNIKEEFLREYCLKNL